MKVRRAMTMTAGRQRWPLRRSPREAVASRASAADRARCSRTMTAMPAACGAATMPSFSALILGHPRRRSRSSSDAAIRASAGRTARKPSSRNRCRPADSGNADRAALIARVAGGSLLATRRDSERSSHSSSLSVKRAAVGRAHRHRRDRLAAVAVDQHRVARHARNPAFAPLPQRSSTGSRSRPFSVSR